MRSTIVTASAAALLCALAGAPAGGAAAQLTTLRVENPGSNPDFPEWTSAKTITAPQKISLVWKTGADVTSMQWQLSATPFPPNSQNAPALIASGAAGATPGVNRNQYFTVDLAPYVPAQPPAAPATYYLRVSALDANGNPAGAASNTVIITYEPAGDHPAFAFPTIETVNGSTFENAEQFRARGVPLAMIGLSIKFNGTELLEHQDTLKVEFLRDGEVAASVKPDSVLSLGNGKAQVWVRTPVSLDEGPHYVRAQVRGSIVSNTKPIYVGPERMDAALFLVLNQRTVPAAGAAYVTRNGLKGIGAAGSRAYGGPGDVTIDDRWHIGSDTKAMTATLAGILAEKGVISFSTTPWEVFPEFRATMQPALRNVTVSMLMAHRAGLAGGPYSNFENASYLARPGLTEPLRRYLYAKLLLHTAPSTPPNTTWTYSNRGFILVAAMLEKRTGKTWEQLMMEELFTPLGITTAGFGPPGDPTIVTQPRGHVDGAAGPVPSMADNTLASGPAGNVHLSLADWARFIRLHLNGREGTLSLKPATLTMLHTPYPSADAMKYAAGWGIDPVNQVLSHDGSNNLWYARAVVDLKNGRATLAVVNRADTPANGNTASKACNDIVIWLRKRYGW